jgi:thiol-disulfide isomerase/thioredoxin
VLPLLTLAALLSGVPEGPAIGAIAPDFALTPLGAAPLRFAEATASHRSVVIVFFSVVCPYSNFSDPHLLELSAEYGPKGVLLVGVDSNRTEPLEEVAAHAREKVAGLAVMKDDGNRIADLLGARVTPEAFVFDHEGRLRYRGRVRSKMGATDLKDALDAVLAGRPVRTPVAKAFGCTIIRE